MKFISDWLPFGEVMEGVQLYSNCIAVLGQLFYSFIDYVHLNVFIPTASLMLIKLNGVNFLTTSFVINLSV